MRIESVIQENREARLTVFLENEKLEQARRRAAREISRKIRIPGFRPGKAPYEVIRRMVGEESITQEALELVIPETYETALKESGLEPFAAGRLEEYELTPELKFTFIVPLKPEVVLPEDYRQIRLPYEPPAVTEEDVQRFLRSLQQDYAFLESVDRPAQIGDMVLVKLWKKGRPEPAELEPLRIYLDPETSPDKIYTRLIENLIGREKHEQFEITLPASPEEELEDYVARVVLVFAATLPSLEELAAHFTAESPEKLTEMARQELISERKIEYLENYVNRVLDILQERTRLAYPPVLLDKQLEEMLEELEEDLSEDGMTLDMSLQMEGISREELIEKMREAAKYRLERDLIMEEIFSREGLQAPESEVFEHFASHLRSLQAQGVKNKELREKLARILKHSYEFVKYRAAAEFLKGLASGELERHEQEKRAEEETEFAGASMAEEGLVIPEAEAEGAASTGPSAAMERDNSEALEA